MKKRRVIWGSVVAVVALLLLACLGTVRGRGVLFGGLGATAFEADSRIRVEPGAELFADAIAADLDAAIARIEAVHGHHFETAPRIWVCATQESFNRRMGAAQGRATGAVFVGRVLLSPRAFEIGAERNVLRHELSHLALQQQVGRWRWLRDIPRWFSEGLSMVAASEALPDPFVVDHDMASRAILNGRAMTPHDQGRLPPRAPSDHGLAHPMFYRQGEMFTRWIATADRDLVERLDRLEAGVHFAEAFDDLDGLNQAWNDFVVSLEARGQESSSRPGEIR